MDSVDWVLIPEDFHTIHSKKLFRLIFSFLSKHALAQMDSARSEEGLRIQSSPVEISLLWKIYTFLLTEDGKQQLHDGILSMMDLSFEWIDSQDVEDIYSVSGIAHRETCERLAEKIASVNSRVQSIVNAWRYVKVEIFYLDWGSIDNFLEFPLGHFPSKLHSIPLSDLQELLRWSSERYGIRGDHLRYWYWSLHVRGLSPFLRPSRSHGW